MADVVVYGDNEGFSPEEFEDVVTCLKTLLSVRAGSQPLDREFGINYDGIVGYPEPIGQNMISVEIIDKVNRYEPRAEVDNVTFTPGTDGQMVPHVHFIKNDNYEPEEETEEEDEEA